MDEKGKWLAKRKFTRKSGPKVKSGCLTCKIRRKKCDETRPACTRCVETGRKCDFVSHSTSNYIALPPPLPIALQHEHGPTLSYPPSFLPISQRELSQFSAFRYICERKFSNHFEISVWQSLALRVANAEPCIFHALIAVGALSQLEDPQLCLSMHDVAGTGFEYPMKRYNMAIKALNERLDSSSESWILAILGSLIFITFELLIGRQDVARMHMQSALNILKSRNMSSTSTGADAFTGRLISTPDQSKSQFLPQSSSGDLDTLICTFSLLDVQASSFQNMYKIMSIRIPTLPTQFNSLNSAWKTLNEITTAVYCLTEQSGTKLRTLPHSLLPPYVAGQRMRILSLLTAWREQFDEFVKDDSSSRNLANDKKKAGIATLYIYHLVSWIRLSSYFYLSPLIFDSFSSEFLLIMKHAVALLEFDQFQAQHHQSTPMLEPCVILDIGLVQPLFFVATSCRHPRVRRRAIEVMEKVRREQVEDVALLVQVARWVVKQEEKQTVPQEAQFICEVQRFQNLEIEFFTEQGRKSCKVIGRRWIVENGWEELHEIFH